MKYFLTGATGFIGSVLTRQLVQAGHTIIALVRNPVKAQELKALGVVLAPGDITDKESMRAAMVGVDGVFHLAAWYKIGAHDKSQAEKINLGGTRNVLELMQELRIPKGVYTSTVAVNSDTHGQLVDETYRFQGQHLSEYDRTKAAAHALALEKIKQGLPLVIVMPGLVYGPGDTSTVRANFVSYLKRQMPMMPRSTAFSWAHVEDTAHAHWLAMEKGRPGETYLICGPTHKFADAMRLAQKITGVPAPLVVPDWLVGFGSWLAGWAEPFLPLPETYTAEGLRIVAGATYIADNSKALRELGYEPRPLETGLAETLRHEMALLGMKPRRS